MHTVPFVVGVDLGGTKTELVVLSNHLHEPQAVVHRERVATPQSSYTAILDAIEGLFLRAQHTVSSLAGQTTRFSHLGVGAPGTTTPETGLIKNANTTCLIGQPLQTDLSHRLGVPVFVENDANCFTLSEATDGAGQNANIVFGVILGTGVGGGLSINGKILQGRHGIAGEWGHNPLPLFMRHPRTTDLNDSPHPEPTSSALEKYSARFVTHTPRPCYCGLSDCIETYLSGPGFVNSYQEWVSWSSKSDQSKPHFTKQMTTPENLNLCAIDVIELAQNGDTFAVQALNQYVQQLASSLAGVVNLIDPDVIVLGGGMSNVTALYPLLKDAMQAYVFTDRFTTPILQAKFGDASGVRGAAWLGAT